MTATPQQVTFAEFMQKLGTREMYPNARDCTRTRLKDGPALEAYTQAREILSLPERGHRCHISSEWEKRLATPRATKENILVSQGVRHSLEVLMRGWAELGYTIALPSDVYPVYLSIAQKVGIKVVTYPLHPHLEPQGWQEADVMLTANPVKPRGTRLAEREVDAIRYWLSQAPHRRVVVDAVYDFAPQLSDGTRALMETSQCIVLHSLSKIWLEPLVAGICVVPPGDAQAWTPLFRQEEVEREKLALAEAWMKQFPMFPDVVRIVFVRMAMELQLELAEKGLHVAPRGDDHAPGYLLQVNGSFEEVLEKGFLGMPQFLFGGKQENVVVLSALPMA